MHVAPQEQADASRHNMQNQACLWTPAELSGWLDKKGTGYNKWNKRFFILKGSGLFYFSDIKGSVAKGVIPIELAKVEAARDKTEKKRFLIKVWVATAYTDVAKHRRYILSAQSSQVQATWVTLLWYASVPRPDMLAQLHASGLLQSLLLKNMQAAYARMQGAAVQGGDAGHASLVGMPEPAQSAAMQDAMQLMFGPDGTAMHFPLPTAQEQEQQQQELEGQPFNKPALMQRLSVLARGPADAPSLRPFNMLAAPTISLQPSGYLSQSPEEASSGLVPAQYTPSQDFSPNGGAAPSSVYADMGDMTHLAEQPRLSMTGVVTDASSAQDPWLSSEPLPILPAAKKGHKHSTAPGARQRRSKAGQLHAVSEATSAVEARSGEQDVQAEFSFSPLGDSSGRIQDIAFSPLAAGAGQVQPRPSIAQRIRKSLFGAATGSNPSGDPNHVKAEAQRLPRMSAAYGFIAAPPGSALHAPSQPLRPVPNMNKRRGTLKPAVAGTTLPQEAEVAKDLGTLGLVGDAIGAGKPQQAPPPSSPVHELGSPKRQTISGETSRGRSPEPDPTGTEDSPLSQVIQQQRAALRPVAADQEEQPLPMVEPLVVSPPSQEPLGTPSFQQHAQQQQQQQAVDQQQLQWQEKVRQERQLEIDQLQRKREEELQEKHSQQELRALQLQQQQLQLEQDQLRLQEEKQEEIRQQQSRQERLRQQQQQQQQQQQKEQLRQAELQQQQEEEEQRRKVQQQQNDLLHEQKLQQRRQEQRQQQEEEVARQQQQQMQQQQQQMQQQQQQQMQQQGSLQSQLRNTANVQESYGGTSPSSASPVDDSGDDAELQLLIQQQRAALRHLEALTARRTQQRCEAALGLVPQRGGIGWGQGRGRSSTPVPESSPEPLPQQGVSSRATTPVPSSSPDMQSPSKMMRQSSLSTAPFSASGALPSRINVTYGKAATSPTATSPNLRAGASSPVSLQAQLASVNLRHRPPGSPSPVPSSSTAQSPVPTPSPPAPPPLPPLSPRNGPKQAPLQGLLPSTVNGPVSQNDVFVSVSRSATPSQAAPPPSPPPPPPPPPPQSASLGSAQLRSRKGNGVLPPTAASVTTVQSNAHSRPVQPQSQASFERPSPSTSPRLGIDSRARYGRQPAAGSSGSLAAGAGQQQAAGVSGMPRLQQQPLQHAAPEMSQDSFAQGSATQHAEQQQAWRQPPDRDAESDGAGCGRIAAVHASQPLLGPAAVAELQSGVKKRWPTVQSNPLYQQADADAPASAAVTPGAKKHGWVVRTQPNTSTHVDHTSGNTVQMLRQTWDRPADRASDSHLSQGSQINPGSDHQDASRFQAQLQASMADRRGRFSQQL